MKTIYVIQANFEDIESCPEMIGWVETKELAEEKVESLNNNLKLAEEYKEKIFEYRSSIYDTIEKENEEIVPSYPKWKAGIHQNEITKEMRDERTRIKNLIIEIQVRNQEKYNRFEEKLNAKVQEFINTLNINGDIMKEINEKWDSPHEYSWIELEEMNF